MLFFGMPTDCTLVLLPGAGLGPQLWTRLPEYLSTPVLAVTYPKGSDERLQDYLDHIIQEIDDSRIGDMVVVAHSIGGCLAPQLCAHYGPRVKGLLAIGAVIPRSGTSFAGSMPIPQRWVLPLLLRWFGTRPPDDAIRKQLCHDLDQEQTAEVIESFTPESRYLYTDRVEYATLPDRRCYVRLTDDRSLSQHLQSQMIEILSATEIRELPCGHLPMLSRPAELAGILENFSSEACQSM